jgi:hypothetical protein
MRQVPVLVGLLLFFAAHEAALAQRIQPKPDASDEFFTKGMIPEIRIRVGEKEAQQLRANPRQYVDCTFTENGQAAFTKVKIKLKGAAGSFRGFDDRPALTLSMKKKGERFHGMDKFHLNNSVQDESYVSELLCSQLCQEAGCPAARASHARVWLNDRDLGFYGLKEGFDEVFLARHFANPTGNLYDGGFCQDIDAALEKDEGEGPDDRSDLKALIDACREPDPAKRATLVAERLDVPAFLNFVAMELMMCHWDGYAQNRNNYRVYFRADNKQAYFFPHGMDQMFGDPGFSVYHVPGPIVTSAVLNNPDWRAMYRARVRELLPLFATEKLHAKIDAAFARMRPVLAAISEDRAKHVEARVNDFKNRVANRQKNIIAQSPPEPVAFNAEKWAPIPGWEPRPVGDAKLERKAIGGQQFLSLETGPSQSCAASFRTKALLPRGSYRLEAKVKPTGLVPLTDEKGAGAGLRLSGGNRQNQVSGTGDWQLLSHAFDIAEEQRDVELVAELRSTAGGVLFDAASLRLVKVK